MDGGWLHRARWRRRGAWLRPAYVVLTAADALIAVVLPPAGDSVSPIGILILAAILNLVAALVVALPGAWMIRRVWPQVPAVVARDRAGTSAVSVVTAVFLGLGLGHHSQVQADRAALRDAQRRAVEFIDRRAPAEFRATAMRADTFTIQAGSVYRTCVPDRSGSRSYCVIVRRHMPPGKRVVFGGYEPNSLFSEGVG